jgi:hypothetical protein
MRSGRSPSSSTESCLAATPTQILCSGLDEDRPADADSDRDKMMPLPPCRAAADVLAAAPLCPKAFRLLSRTSAPSNLHPICRIRTNVSPAALFCHGDATGRVAVSARFRFEIAIPPTRHPAMERAVVRGSASVARRSRDDGGTLAQARFCFARRLNSTLLRCLRPRCPARFAWRCGKPLRGSWRRA